MGKIIFLSHINGGHVMDIFDIANTFLSFESMSNLKLQKLCYYAQAWHLALNNEPLVDCEFQAWIHGPVCPQLYQQYKGFGFNKIPKSNIPECIASNDYLKEFLGSIFEIYGEMSAKELEFLTHKEDPWTNARIELEDWQSSCNPISEEDMREYYSNLMEREE